MVLIARGYLTSRRFKVCAHEWFLIVARFLLGFPSASRSHGACILAELAEKRSGFHIVTSSTRRGIAVLLRGAALASESGLILSLRRSRHRREVFVIPAHIPAGTYERSREEALDLLGRVSATWIPKKRCENEEDIAMRERRFAELFQGASEDGFFVSPLASWSRERDNS